MAYQLPLGILETDNDNNIIDYIEKPVYHFDVSMGIYCISPEVLEYIEKNVHLDINYLILNLIKDGKNVKSYKEDCSWLDIGRVDDYEVAADTFEKNRNLYLGGNDI